jgi:hypothetical protein
MDSGVDQVVPLWAVVICRLMTRIVPVVVSFSTKRLDHDGEDVDVPAFYNGDSSNDFMSSTAS